MTKILDSLKCVYYSQYDDMVSIHELEEDVDPEYGLDVVPLDMKHINALLGGKALYFSDGEYAYILVMRTVKEAVRK